MKANEFVKRFGTGEAKRLLKDSHGCSSVSLYGGEYKFDTDDLKRLVESHELMESKGGLDAAKNIVKSQHNLYTDMRLVQAIADVEACEEVL